MALPMHLGDTREPHWVYCLFHTLQTRASILTIPNEPSTCGEPVRRDSLSPASVARHITTALIHPRNLAEVAGERDSQPLRHHHQLAS
jgi:hypothetical protein